MGISFHLNVYEGPLEFLYDLIKKEKIDIYDVPIFEITNQFVQYIESMRKFDLEIASEFLVMASELLQIKSKYLLYNKDEEEQEQDPRLPLAQKLAEYKKYKTASEYLKERSFSQGESFIRKKEEVFVEEEFDFSELTIEKIIKSISNILRHEESEKLIEKTYKRNKHSIEEKSKLIIQGISSEKEIPLSSFVYTLDPEEKIVTFLCALEMVRKGRARLFQTGFAEPIFIKGGADHE